MNITSTLFHQIETLPVELQMEVMEFVKFIRFKNDLPLEEETQLTDAQKQELDARYERYLANPEKVSSFEDVKKRLLKKHGGI